MVLFQSIVSNCPLCNLCKGKLAQQKIGKLSKDILGPAPPFSQVSNDLSGPFIIKLPKKARVNTKVGVLIYICNNSRAMETEVVHGYDTEVLIKGLCQVFSIQNFLDKITSDPRCNMVKSRSLLSDTALNKVEKEFPTIEWKVLPPKAPHRNGGPESMVKSVKLSLKYLAMSYLTYTDFRVVIKGIQSSINN